MTAGLHIDYEALAQDAMRGVIRAVLAKVAQSGLLGDHHFYIAFNTHGTGVSVSKRLREKYPVEMTIVLQHRFWDLEVGDERFEVKLTFDGIPERLVVPYRAVKVFYDPSVPYGLQFEESELTAESARRTLGMPGADQSPGLGNGLDHAGMSGRASQRQGTPDREEKRRERPQRRPRSEKPTEVPASLKPEVVASAMAERKPAAVAKIGSVPAHAKPVLTEAKSQETAPKPDAAGGSKVVDLSKFRKK